MMPVCLARCDFYVFGSREPCWGKVTVGAYYDGAEHLCEGHPSRGSTSGRYRPEPAAKKPAPSLALADTEASLADTVPALTAEEREEAGRAAHLAHVCWAQEEGEWVPGDWDRLPMARQEGYRRQGEAGARAVLNRRGRAP